LSTPLPTDIKEDDFLNIYEDVDKRRDVDLNLNWVPAMELKLPASHGLTTPWRLSPRLIPAPRYESKRSKAIHNIRSTEPRINGERASLTSCDSKPTISIRLPAGSSHYIELEVEHP
jgi:hypothetical protein